LTPLVTGFLGQVLAGGAFTPWQQVSRPREGKLSALKSIRRASREYTFV